MREKLENLSDSLGKEATVVDDAMGNTIEKVVQREIVPPPFGYNDPAAFVDDNDLPLDSVFLTKTNSTQSDVHAPAVTLLKGKNKHFIIYMLVR
jgi:hypothetical protein